MIKKKIITAVCLLIFSSAAFACAKGGDDESVFVTKTVPTDYENSVEESRSLIEDASPSPIPEVSEADTSSEKEESPEVDTESSSTETNTESSNEEADKPEETNVTEDFKVELAEYKGIELILSKPTVTNAEIQERIYSLVDNDIEYIDSEGKIKTGDIVNINMTGTAGNDVVYDYTQNNYDLCIGYADFGEDFDNSLTGAEAGDKLEFSITYDKNDTYAEFPGKTIKYIVSVNSVTSVKLPEMTSDYLFEKFEVNSEAELRSKISDEILEEKEENSKAYCSQLILHKVIKDSSVLSYSDAQYEKAKKEFDKSYDAYRESYDVSSNLELYTLMGLSKEDIESGILDILYKNAVVSAIYKAEALDADEEDMESAVLEFLYDNAVITEKND